MTLNGPMPLPLTGSAPDFLAAIKASFNDPAAGLGAGPSPVITGGLWDIAPDRSPNYPLCVIKSVQAPEPGESLEDRRINVTFTIRANTEASAEACGKALMAWFDPNPSRAPLEWATGHETFNWREDTDIERPSQRVKDGARLWVYTIPYVFHVYDQVP